MLQHLHRLTITAGVTAIALASGCSEAATRPTARSEVSTSLVPEVSSVGELSLTRSFHE